MPTLIEEPDTLSLEDDHDPTMSNTRTDPLFQGTGGTATATTTTMTTNFLQVGPGSAGETAKTADLDWMNQELLLLDPNPQRQGDGDDGANSTNDTTLDFPAILEAMKEKPSNPKECKDDSHASRSLSRTLDEEDLIKFYQDHSSLKTQATRNHGAMDVMDDAVLPGQPNQIGDHADSYISQLSTSRHLDTSVHSVLKCSMGAKQNVMKMGPNEQLYNETYRDFVQSRIQQFRKQYPNEYIDYKSLNAEQKQREQTRVLNLLQRLKITGTGIEKENWNQNDQNDSMEEQRDVQPCKHLSPEHSSFDKTVDPSMNLLSPSNQSTSFLSLRSPHSPSLSQPGNTQPTWYDEKNTSFPIADGDDDEHSTQSVEIPRSDPTNYESPDQSMTHSKKRLASASGKRGADHARVRLEDGSFESVDQHHHSKLDDDTPSKDLTSSIRRLSLNDEKVLFTLSQSPIPQHPGNSPIPNYSPNDFPRPDISFGDDEPEDCEFGNIGPGGSAAGPSPIRCDNDSLVETTMMLDKRVRWDFDGKCTKEAPTAVHLRKNATFHLPPIPTAQRQPRQQQFRNTQTFPDPLNFYPDKVQHRLRKLYDWILDRDPSYSSNKKNKEGVSVAVVLSLLDQQVIDSLLKLHLENPPEMDIRSGCNDLLLGNTLVVVRSKNELENWASSFREGSAFSVLNHAALHLKERKSLSAAQMATRYDCVLTTFDALKSPDCTLTLDNNGFACHEPTGMKDGWFSSKSSSQSESSNSEQYKQLSVLHRVLWRRVVFVDVVGRKSYLAKAGTARVFAARAINADCRFLFFVTSEDNPTTGFEALKRSDRNALSSLSSILRLPQDESGTYEELRANIVDFKVRSTKSAETNEGNVY
jgi:hypothetical protein